jgi:hypothetical protein
VTYDRFNLSGSARVTISGDVTIWVQGTGDGDGVSMVGSSKVIIPEGSSLTMYVADDIDIEQDAEFNADTTGTDRFTLYGYGARHVDLKENAVMCGIVYTVDSFHIKDNTRFYGKVLAWEEIKMEDNSQIHQDLALGGFASGGSAATFGQQSLGGSSVTLEKDQAASMFTLTEAMTISSISAYVYGGDGGGYVAFAIYDHDAADNEPGNLLAESGSQWVSDDTWQWETGVIPSTALAPGTYWLAMATDGSDDDMMYRYTSGGKTEHQDEDAERNGFDADWDDSTDKGEFSSRTITIYASGTANNSDMPDAADETATANDGTYEGDAIGGYAGFGDGGKSIRFDGDGDYVEVAHDSSYLLNAGSISFHAYPTDLGGTQGLFSKDSSGNDTGGQVTVYTNGTRIAATIETTVDDPYGTGSTITLQSGSGVMNEGAWNHVAVTWGDGQFRLYHDGVLIAAANHLGGLGTTSGGAGNTEPFVIGASTSTSGDGVVATVTDEFTGRIDDVRIYDLPLDIGQVGDLQSASDPGARTAPGYVIADTSSYSTAADFLIYDATAVSWLGGGGLQVNSDTLATTVGAAAKIHDGIEATGEFSVELIITRMTPGSTDRPSYIFNYSDTTASAFNVLIGQDDENYEAQVRDSDTGTTGVLSPALLSTTALNSGSDTHLVISYSAGEVRTFVDGVLDETRTTIGTLNNWDATYFMVLFGAYDEAEYWNGTIKRMAIFDRAMNASQAESVYNGEEPGDGVGGTGVARWDEQD